MKFAVPAFALVALAALPARAQFPRLAPPVPCQATAPAAQALTALWAEERPRTGRRSLAVFPLLPEIDNATRVHLAVSLPDRIRQRLATSPQLLVASDGSVSRAMYDTRELRDSATIVLGVDYTLTGNVVVVGNRQEVQMALRRRGESQPVWQSSFRSTTSAKAIEDAVVSGVSRALGLSSAPSPVRGWPTSAEAWEAVSAGDVYFRSATRAGADSAAAAYAQAFALEPGAAVTASRLARAYLAVLERGGQIPQYTGVAATNRIFWLTTQSLVADSAWAEAWTVRGMLARHLDPVRFEGAVAAHQRAVALDPADADAEHEYGVTLMRLGDNRGATARFRRAMNLEPSRASTLAALAEMELRNEDWGAACVLTNASIGAWPYDPIPYAVRAQARLRLSDARNAYADAELVARMSAEAWVGGLQVLVARGASNVEVARQRSRGLTARWLATNAVLSPRDAEYLALAYLSVGDERRAVEVLRRARPVGTDLGVAIRSPGLAAVRSDTAVVRLMRETAESRGQGAP